ncbi:hypothetical protein KSZ_58410 [Dictyobacter formicarum]|uniref:Uncharacterized protein n=1 Tax=Dictyobacter formicarum TaxID=2778368 RepID=A0ABQ3VP39_9CHLR|nr:hypothetical protein KSZ_58410 [Dictyobacter formicarum]
MYRDKSISTFFVVRPTKIYTVEECYATISAIIITTGNKELGKYNGRAATVSC